MIIAKFKVDGQITVSRLPGSWDEMKVRHYLAVETTTNPLELMSLLSDVDLSKIINTKTDLRPVLNKLIEVLNKEFPDFKDAPKRDMSVNGKTVKLPNDFSKVTFGQSAMIDNYLAMAEGDERKAVLQIMAVVLQPLIDKGPFNLEKAKYYERLIGELPIKEVFPNLFFFWEVLKEYTIIGVVNLRQYQ